ncbi:MAG: response regulator transcription factor [Oscillospiraceae bacterium]|nr:response regulator transcription factor [Oscillospiraceae bacterium]
MYRILVCDDEEGIRTLISKYAKYEGHHISLAENGEAAIQKCREEDFDIIIMDIMMPYLDGFSTAKEIRKFSQVPIIMLSARGEEYDRIHGFEVGADDYVVKPFSPKELMMRVDVIMRRVERTATPKHDVYSKDGLEIDFTARKVLVNGTEAVLAPKEYELLFYLVRNKGIAVSRERLLTDIWGYEFFGDDRTLDTHIKLLRKHIGEYSSLIVTLRGIGYRFEG